jgi:SAM-dependent methyltransferase
MLQHVDFAVSTLSTTPGHWNNTILDLGCGDGLVLVQALETFSFSQLPRAIGVDLDRPLLEAARARIQQEHPPTSSSTSSSSTSNDISEYDILSRLELYHGDLTEMHEPLTTIMAPPPPPPPPHPNPTTTFSEPTTMDTLINQSSHLFVYLLPEALSKLAPLLLDALITKHKVVLSMRWEIPELSDYLVHGGEHHQFYIYQSTAK